VFLHYEKTEDVDSFKETITASFRLSIPVYFEHSDHYINLPRFNSLFALVYSVGEYICGERGINDCDNDGYTLLKHACIANAASLIEPLFWRGIVFADDTLFYAIHNGNFDTVQFCLALGADPNPSSYAEQDSPLMAALEGLHTSSIAALLIEYGADVWVRDSQGKTPLHLAARQANAGLLRMLLAKDSSPEYLAASDEYERCALHEAILYAECPHASLPLECVTILLDAGADATFLDSKGRSPLAIAAQWDCEAVVRLLLERVPSFTQNPVSLERPLTEAVIENNKPMAQILIEAGASANDQIMFNHAVKHSSAEMVQLLFGAGARPEHISENTIDYLRDLALNQRDNLTEEFWSNGVAKYKLLRQYRPFDQNMDMEMIPALALNS
jgi:hypothetical protein